MPVEDAASETGHGCLLHDGLHKGRAWEDYARLHRRSRAALAAGDSPPILVWACRAADDTCGASHLQIQGLLKAFYIAVQTGRAFFVDWSHRGSNFAELFQARRVDWHLPRRLNCNGTRNVTVTGRRSRAWPHEWPESCVFLGSRVAPTRDDAEAGGGSPLRPGCAWRFLFRASPVLSGLLATRRQSGVGADGLYVAVHAPASGMALAALERVSGRELLRGLLLCAGGLPGRPQGGVQRGESGSLPIVIYTNSADVRNMSGGDRLQSTLHVVSIASGIEDKSIGPTQTSLSSSTPREKWLAAWADLWALAQASGIVRPTESGFSRWAAELGLLPPDRLRSVAAGRGEVACDEGAAELW